MNRVRAGVVTHPEQWQVSGFNDIQQPPTRYRIIDQQALIELGHFRNEKSLKQHHREWIETQITNSTLKRESLWTESLAVGSKQFVNNVKTQLGTKTRYRSIEKTDDTYTIKEQHSSYSPHID